jgi:hypothetical protein
MKREGETPWIEIMLSILLANLKLNTLTDTVSRKLEFYDRKLALEILTQISDAIQKIKKRFAPINSAEKFTNSDEGVEKLDAICMQLIAVGESLKNLDKITSKKGLPNYPEID